MGFVRDLTGRTAADAARKAGDLQGDASGEASDLFDSFGQLGQSGVQQSGFLTDPNAQFDFLQNNPLFQMGLDNANTQTMQSAAARGRLSAGDTLQQLNNNALLVASPLIQQQKQSIGDLLTIGQNTASNQSNLLTGGAAAQAAGIVGQANARSAGSGNILNLAGQLAGGISGLGSAGAVAAPAGLGSIGAAGAGSAGAGLGSIGGLAAGFSDPSLKDNITLIGKENGHNIYTWDWNESAINLGLSGSGSGVMADEVANKNPEAVTIDRGFMKVDYNAIGVKH